MTEDEWQRLYEGFETTDLLELVKGEGVHDPPRHEGGYAKTPKRLPSYGNSITGSMPGKQI